MELVLTLCNMLVVPLTTLSIVFGGALVVSVIFRCMNNDMEYPRSEEKKGEVYGAIYKSSKSFVLPWVLLLLFASLTHFPSALIDARVQMIKLEIMDEGVRHEVYENIQGILKKLEDKYLGSDSAEKK